MGAQSAFHIAGDLLDDLFEGNDILAHLAPGVKLEVDANILGGLDGTHEGPGAVLQVLRSLVPHPHDVEVEVASPSSGHQVQAWIDDYCVWVDTAETKVTYLHVMTMDGFAVRSLFAAYRSADKGARYEGLNALFSEGFTFTAGQASPVGLEGFVIALNALIDGRKFSVEVRPAAGPLPIGAPITVAATITVAEEAHVMYFQVGVDSKVAGASYPGEGS